MLGIVSEDENHNKTFKPMAGATLGQGVPLGAWCSFEKDVAPSSNWLRAGTTFDSNTYPALALYLGTNKVPERYATYKDTRVFMDLNNPNSSLNGTSITIPNASHVTSMEALGTTRNNQQETAILAVDLTTATSLVFGFGGGGYTITLSGTYDATSDTWTIANATGRGLFVNYDELGAEETRHPLFIKATSIASDSDKDSILAQIQAFNTYSTEETLTGETWLDGKPIYKKCFYSATNWANNAVIGNVSNFDSLVMIQSVSKNFSNSRFYMNYDDRDNANCASISVNGDVVVNRLGAFVGSAPAWVTIKYTKTV